jgi:nucleoside phosphorylase
MKRARPSDKDYTVGWICALPIERAAAEQVLDEEHEENADGRPYTLGRIASHNVVIGCLPAGQIGVTSAAVIATSMKAVFPAIRFGLMVGIGGGVPSEEADIRLGDVVISQPHGQHGGVVQYDFGKAGAGGKLSRTGFLNAPPAVLLDALAKLRTNHIRGKTRINTHLSHFNEIPEFMRDRGPDVLFAADYSHAGGATCDECCKEYAVKRKLPAGKELGIHYGTIASGNRVIKDGVTRDKMSAELGGVLCFEMEAAGLMNNFPCLVIRGISDYADSHKNKAWQPYAAATAAACGKEILSAIAPHASDNFRIHVRNVFSLNCPTCPGFIPNDIAGTDVLSY